MKRNVQIVSCDERIDTEVIYIGKDSPGVFIRGDDCLSILQFRMIPRSILSDENIDFKKKKTILVIPYSGRIETGAVQFGKDWPGLFIRKEDLIVLTKILKSMEREKFLT